MPLPTDRAALHARVEANLAAFLVTLAARQVAYLAAKGRYWQGPQNPASVPVDEDATARMDAALKMKGVDRVLPSGKRLRLDPPVLESWGDIGLDLPDGAGCSVAVMATNGPAGHGYAVVARLKLGEDEFIRVIRVAPDAGESDWKKIKRRR